MWEVNRTFFHLKLIRALEFEVLLGPSSFTFFSFSFSGYLHVGVFEGIVFSKKKMTHIGPHFGKLMFSNIA